MGEAGRGGNGKSSRQPSAVSNPPLEGHGVGRRFHGLEFAALKIPPYNQQD